jgi:hypothetical protein
LFLRGPGVPAERKNPGLKSETWATPQGYPAITIVIKARNLPADLSHGRYEKSRYAFSSFLSMWFFPCEHALAMACWNLFPIREIPSIATPTRRIFD